MREIKFRAWDKERQDMRMVTLMDWREWWVTTEEVEDTGAHPLDFGERNSFKNEETDRHILMQYTGLKDKNGKEIYEGDILHVLEVSNTRDLEYKSAVEFIDSGFLVTQPDECQVPLAVFHNLSTSYPLFEIEVIGNIYEHSHLLEE